MVLCRPKLSHALAALFLAPLVLAAKCDGALSLGGAPNARRAEAGASDGCEAAGCGASEAAGTGALGGTGGSDAGGQGGKGGRGGSAGTVRGSGGAATGGAATGGADDTTGGSDVGGRSAGGSGGTGGAASGASGSAAGGKSGAGGDTGIVISCGSIILEPSDFCDGVAKCPDASDEYGCPHPFACDDGSTVDLRDTQICDYVDDCSDGTDEVGCLRYSPWQCQDGTEIRTAQLCDTFFDCPDHSDEGHCALGDQTICTAGPERGLAYDAEGDCLREGVPIGCAELIPSALTVPTSFGMDNCARRKRDGLLVLVPSPVWATDWEDCTDEERARFVDKAACP